MSNTCDVDTDDVAISVNTPKILPRRSSSTAMDIYSEIRQSKEEELRRIIQEQESKIALLENEVTTLRNIIESSKDSEERENKKRKRADGSTDDGLIQEKQNLRKQVDHLTERLGERENELHEVREKLAESEWKDASPSQNSTEDILNKIGKLIDNKMDKIEKKIADIETKQSQTKEEVKLSVQSVVSKNKESTTNATSYASALSKNLDRKIVGDVITAARNTEKVQEIERQKREQNFIIYGAVLSNESEAEYIKGFFNTIGVTAKPKLILRIGKEDHNRQQPLKITMESTKDKDQVMSRLVNLKHAEDKYSAISVRDDHTYEERQMIKDWNEKAKSLNETEPSSDYEFKLRGSPKNGLRIIRIPKKKVSTETTLEN